jgi:hypothetical protein
MNGSVVRLSGNKLFLASVIVSSETREPLAMTDDKTMTETLFFYSEVSSDV